MASAIGKIIVKSITRVVKSTSKFDIVVDDLIDEFKSSCPPKPELLRLVAQKNQIQTALSGLGASINTLQTTANTTKNIITSIQTAVSIIKAIPIPTSVPPGVGIPINVITILADSLDILGKLLDGAKGSVSIVPTATKVIGENINNVLNKLGELDVLVNGCIDELAAGLNQQEKNELINEIGNAASTAGDFSNLGDNVIDEEALLDRLSPNSADPLIYKRFILQTQSNDDNPFSFPQRRIRAYRERQQETRQATLAEKNWFSPRVPGFNGMVTDTYPQQTFTNLPDGGYSYSTSVKVLINEVKFRIDQEARLDPFKTANQIEIPEVPVSIAPTTQIAPPTGGNTGGNTGGGGGSGGGGGGGGSYNNDETYLNNQQNPFGNDIPGNMGSGNNNLNQL
tara:strand:+ start:2084 stop:3274 length:1191 start_codon:yes stop_codon:yes gene_type:complete